MRPGLKKKGSLFTKGFGKDILNFHALSPNGFASSMHQKMSMRFEKKLSTYWMQKSIASYNFV